MAVLEDIRAGLLPKEPRSSKASLRSVPWERKPYDAGQFFSCKLGRLSGGRRKWRFCEVDYRISVMAALSHSLDMESPETFERAQDNWGTRFLEHM